MTGRLILVRHGQTEANVAKRLDTALPGAKLTPEGLAQAETLGIGLASAPPLALVSSLALRARQTAGFVEQAAGVSLDVRDGLHEVQAGDLEDRTDEAAHRLFMETFITGTPATSALASPVVKRDTTSWSGTSPSSMRCAKNFSKAHETAATSSWSVMVQRSVLSQPSLPVSPVCSQPTTTWPTPRPSNCCLRSTAVGSACAGEPSTRRSSIDSSPVPTT